MNHSPLHLNYGTSDYGLHEFDPHVDFSQFLEEARQHAREVKFQASSTFSDEAGQRKLGEDKKGKKSWKQSLFSWLKKSKLASSSSMEPTSTLETPKPKKCHASGPIYGSSSRGDDMRLQRCPTSSSIANCFNDNSKSEKEMPYTRLDQLSSPHHAKSYGPVYVVT